MFFNNPPYISFVLSSFVKESFIRRAIVMPNSVRLISHNISSRDSSISWESRLMPHEAEVISLNYLSLLCGHVKKKKIK
jgi:hypothetical protein